MIPSRSRSNHRLLSVIHIFRLDRIQAIASVIIVLWVCWFYSTANDSLPLASIPPDNHHLTITEHLEIGVLLQLILSYARDDDDRVFAVGDQHWAEVTFLHKQSCDRFSLRLVGDALVPVVLTKQKDKRKDKWTGQFEIILPGNYTVEWTGCDRSHKEGSTSIVVTMTPDGKDPMAGGLSRPKESYLFAKSVWISTKKMRSSWIDGVDRPDYVWTGAVSNTHQDNDLMLVAPETEVMSAVVSRSGTLTKSHGMYRFSETGNYELVCFWGGPTMASIRHFFLAERKHLSSGQRPFKFHYYNVTNLLHPDSEWTQAEKERCRKCKHIILSLDDIAPHNSQVEFEKQVIDFVGHLQLLLNDATFPIWILTFSHMASPHCHAPYKYPRSTDHPCNDVLRQLTREVFPPQVHLMDNADIVLPNVGLLAYVLANVAMRVFVVVGKGVEDWRAMGQQGLSDGLHRNGTVEPNFPLVPYTDWGAHP